MYESEAEGQIRIFLLVEHGLFRASLARLLAAEPGFEVAGEAGTPADALETLSRSSAEVVLLDFERAAEDADGFISAARGIGYEGKILVLAARADTERSVSALKLGVAGIFLKSESSERLVQAIRLVAAGAFWIDSDIIRLLANRSIDRLVQPGSPAVDQLDGREQRVILGILGGLTNKKIATGMGVSESSVKNIVQGLFSKAGVRTRSQLVRVALEGSLGKVGQFIRRNASAL